MSHIEESTSELTHEELKYQEHIRRASDFMKIDLFLSARKEYEKALEYRPEDPFATEQMVLCNSNISRDRKKVLVIAPVVILIIIAIALL